MKGMRGGRISNLCRQILTLLFIEQEKIFIPLDMNFSVDVLRSRSLRKLSFLAAGAKANFKWSAPKFLNWSHLIFSIASLAFEAN